MASPSINDCLTQLQSNLGAELVSNFAKKVYGYRHIDGKLASMVSLSHLGTTPANQTTGSRSRSYEFGAILLVNHDGTAAQLESAEQTINDLENAIYDTLEGTKNHLWLKVVFDRASVKPPSPAEFPGARYGEVYFRLILKDINR